MITIMTFFVDSDLTYIYVCLHLLMMYMVPQLYAQWVDSIPDLSHGTDKIRPFMSAATYINSSPPGLNGRHFQDYMFRCIVFD